MKRVLGLLLVAGTLQAGEPLVAEKKAGGDSSAWKLGWKDRPSLRFGKLLRVDFKALVQANYIAVEQDPEPDRDAMSLSRSRIGVEGTFLKSFEYEVEYDFAREEQSWRDVFVNCRVLRMLQVQGGRFKIPFGRDQLTSPAKLDFVYRSRIGAELAPGRQTGFMLHGPILGQGLRYQAGVFLHDGENSYAKDGALTGGRTVGVRVRSVPAEVFRLPELFRTLEAGFALTRGDGYPGKFGPRGRTFYGQTWFPRFEVGGQRSRAGLEAAWSPGRFTFQAEFQQLRQDRLDEDYYSEPLSPIQGRGWYASATYLVAGKRKNGWTRAEHPVFQGGFGALELAFRQEALHYTSSTHVGPAYLSKLSPNLPDSSNRVTTYGINWYLNRHSRMQWNVIRDRFVAPFQNPESPAASRWGFAVRLQFII